MTRTTLLSSPTESTGKTAVALALASEAQERGDDVGYMKPRGTSLESVVGKTLDSDPMLAREVLDVEDEVHEMEPVVYSPTFVEEAVQGRVDPEELRDEVKTAYDKLADGRGLVFLEGADVYTTGGVVGLTDADIARVLDAHVVLIAGFDGYRSVDGILAAARVFGDRLAGVVLNGVEDPGFDDVEGSVVPFLESRGIPVNGVLPYDRSVAGVTVADLRDRLNATSLTDASHDGYVERFLVGAMSGEEALRQFRRTKDAVVVTGADRADVQSAALEAPGVRCIVLAGGLEPPSAVVSKAREKEVPILSVGLDTVAVLDEIEEVVQHGRKPDASTVDTVRDLLTRHADVDALLGD
ncbi:phosphotransacetylase family protein [Haladaptatus sp. F3-133]|uniref:Phosphotransacetylase family protein n=1 Tax=Halorutilus salinus TaxID=2487751 RepID=A0A9Q4C2S0_9EURY|nr:phosphotransacetylase family protein [Halorutilus salinus]MCX2818802.1 phosphotransacetylase family protein [Halorutilus salinus]